ncbi:MAG: hypothetical protein RIM72_08445 [Alphaproteobacteria bacterium]
MAKNKAPVLPKTFQQRGIYLPFTTPVLMYARLRRLHGSSMEILIPGLGGGSETYVIPYKVLPQVINTSVHDRALHEQMILLREVSPAAVRQMASKVAVTGLGGPFLARRAKENMRAEKELPNIILLSLIQTAIRQLAPNHPGVDKLDATTIATADGMNLARDALGGYASSIGERGDKIYGRLEKWASILAPVGSPDETVAGPGLKILHGTEAMAEQLSKWLIQEPPETAEMAQRTVTAAREAVKRARETLANMNALAESMAEPLRDFDNTIAKLKAGVDLFQLVIDGWERIVELWDEAMRGDRFVQRDTLEMFSQFLPILPIEGAGGNTKLWEELRETQSRWTKTAQHRIDSDLDQSTKDKLSQFRKEPV